MRFLMSTDKEYVDYLTNEQLNKRFKNQFDLVRYAIRFAENCVRSGHAPDTQDESENLAFQVLAAIAENKEHFEEIPVKVIPEISMQQEAAMKKQESLRGGREGRKESKRESRQKMRAEK
jgi:hypothetical protein